MSDEHPGEEPGSAAPTSPEPPRTPWSRYVPSQRASANSAPGPPIRRIAERLRAAGLDRAGTYEAIGTAPPEPPDDADVWPPRDNRGAGPDRDTGRPGTEGSRSSAAGTYICTSDAIMEDNA